jgi:hypothetical protein
MNDPSLGVNASVTPLALAIALAMCFAMLALPRRHALIPLVVVTCYLPVSGKLPVASLNFSMLKLVVTFGWLRVFARGEQRAFRWCRLDTAVTIWAVFRVITFTFLWQTSQALINGLGYAYDAIGIYILVRILIQDTEDFGRLVTYFAIALLPVACLMCLEKMSGSNPFYILGTPEVPHVRRGIVRCQGPFAHPILAGKGGTHRGNTWLGVI